MVKKKIGAREHERIHCVVSDQKAKQDDDVTDQNVNQSRTAENDSGRDVYQVRTQEKVETIWLFDTGADAHVMPKHMWEQVGEPTLQTTKVTLIEANGQDLDPLVHRSGCTRRETMPSEWNATQNKRIHIHVESTREFSHTTN